MLNPLCVKGNEAFVLTNTAAELQLQCSGPIERETEEKGMYELTHCH